MDFMSRLARARSGGAILFCGAGFSADCLNFDFDEKFGVGNELMAQLNAKLDEPRSRLDRAASAYRQKHGEHGLMNLLKSRFDVSSVPATMIDILSYPWRRIYTTNYDNAIELALERANRRKYSLSNINAPSDLPPDGLAVIHLHGFIKHWTTLEAFEKSCVLTAESYYQVRDTVGPWFDTLQTDFAGSSLFVFAGFAAADLHLNQILYDKTPRDKVFFVNRPSPKSKVDIDEDQRDFGSPLYIGIAGLAERIREIAAQAEPNEPHCPSFQRYQRPEPATELPSVQAIEDLIIFGTMDRNQIVRDVTLNSSDYHVLRSSIAHIGEAIAKGCNPILVTGEICDGKTILIESLAARLSTTGRPVFFLREAYDSVIKETVELVEAYPQVIIVAESCFELGAERLKQIVTIMEGSAATLILSSRAISAEAEVSEYDILKSRANLHHIRMPQLDEGETRSLARLADQIAGFTGLPGTAEQQIERIRRDCRGRLPRFLAELMKSQIVIGRYAEEYNKIASLTQRRDLMVLIAALYMTHIGHDPSVSLIGNMLAVDCERIVGRVDAAHPRFKLMRIDRGILRTVPSLGARAILAEIIPASDSKIVVDTVVEMLRSLANSRRHGKLEAVFTQLMRYSVISKVVTSTEERNRFFDNVSKIDSCRTYVLFWLQWHMAMVEQKNWHQANIYLERSYTEADNHDRRRPTARPYDRLQIDDRKSKFLMIRGRESSFQTHMFRDVEEACNIAHRLMAREDLTHHPFDTLGEIVSFLSTHGGRFPPTLQQKNHRNLSDLVLQAERRKGLLGSAQSQRKADEAIAAARELLNAAT